MQHVDNLSREDFENALWDFILEHCEIEASGALFVKFHCSGKNDVMRRIRARQKYHRENPRSKEAEMLRMASEHHEDRKAKREEWIRARKERMRKRELANMPWSRRTLQEIKDVIRRRLFRSHGHIVKL